jgi:hypothetical protein
MQEAVRGTDRKSLQVSFVIAIVERLLLRSFGRTPPWPEGRCYESHASVGRRPADDHAELSHVLRDALAQRKACSSHTAHFEPRRSADKTPPTECAFPSALRLRLSYPRSRPWRPIGL